MVKCDTVLELQVIDISLFSMYPPWSCFSVYAPTIEIRVPDKPGYTI